MSEKMRNGTSDPIKPLAENLVLTVREDSPLSQSTDNSFSNSNIENVPEPIFFVNSSDCKASQSESVLLAEIENLKSQLKSLKNSNLEAKITIAAVDNDVKDKNLIIRDLNSQIEKLQKKVKDQENIIEEDQRLVNGRDEHLTRFYDQKMVAFKAQVLELEEKLKEKQKSNEAEIEKWKKIESEMKEGLERTLAEVRAKEQEVLLAKEENQTLLLKLTEESNRNVKTTDATTCTSPTISGENWNFRGGEMEQGLNMGVPLDMMNGMGMVPSSMMMPFCYSMASMMMANMEMSRMMSMSPWGISPMMQPQNYQDSASIFGNSPQSHEGQDQLERDADARESFPAPGEQIQTWQTPAHQSTGPGPITAKEVQKEFNNLGSKSEVTRKKNMDIKKDTIEILTPLTIGSNSKKRNHEDLESSDKVGKKPHHIQERKKESGDVKLDGRLGPQTPTSDTKKSVIAHSKELTSTPVSSKYVADENRGTKSIERSSESSTQPLSSVESRDLDSSSHRNLRDRSGSKDKKDDLDSLVKQRHLYLSEDVMFKAFVACSVLFPSQLRPRVLVEKGILAILVNHTSDRSFPFRIVVAEPERGARLMNVALYGNVQIFQQGSEITVKVLHRRKGAPNSTATRHSKYILNMQNVQEAKALYDIIPSKARC